MCLFFIFCCVVVLIVVLNGCNPEQYRFFFFLPLFVLGLVHE